MTASRVMYAGVLLAVTIPLVWLMLSLSPHAHASEPAQTGGPTAPVSVIGPGGQLIGPLDMPVVRKTEDEWRAQLTEEQFRILRRDGTEPAFCGVLLDNRMEGIYACGGCRLPLFRSSSKFTSGTGWPSFFQPIAEGNIDEHIDTSYMGIPRTEIVCARCEGHLGHVFNDGPQPTGLRFCVNSDSLEFVEQGEVNQLQEVDEIVFAGGCFWCVEAVFEQLDGVLRVESGYAGGTGPAEYRQVISGTTGHAEAVRVVYDPSVITPEKILEVHFATHDPTTLNRQGADVGTQYRSALFYRNDDERAFFERYVRSLNESGTYRNPVVTTVETLNEFHVAEDYHQDYVENNPDNPYVRAVAVPKVEKTRREFGELLRPERPADGEPAPASEPDAPAGNPGG